VVGYELTVPLGLALRVELAQSDVADGGIVRLYDLAAALDGDLEALYLASAPGSSFEPFVLLGAVAQRTTALRLGELATRVDRRPPSLVPKLISTLDVLSAGRAEAALAPPHLGASRTAPVGSLRENAEIVRALLRVPAPHLLTPNQRIDGAWNEPSRGSSEPVPLGLFVEDASFDEETEAGDTLAAELLGLAARLCEWCVIELDANRDAAEVRAELLSHVGRAGRLETDIDVRGLVGLERFERSPVIASELAALGFDALVLDVHGLADVEAARVLEAAGEARAALEF
jgi:alkanesulfonate monooxygenase SsuD/methylene tetrahydromethanopterin reductase-like flavin-dependent oxidoreductase (luciferase family)